MLSAPGSCLNELLPGLNAIGLGAFHARGAQAGTIVVLALRILVKPRRPLHLSAIQQPATKITYQLIPTVLTVHPRETADAMTLVTSEHSR